MDQMRDLRGVRRMRGFQRTEGIGHVAIFFQEELFVSSFERLDVIFRKSSPLQTNQIQTTGGRRISIHNREWRHILNDFCQTTDNRMFSDPAELVRGCKS